MNIIDYKSGRLCMEKVNLQDVAAKYGTPVYCYSTQIIADNLHGWHNAMKSALPEGNFTVCYAVKANSNQAVLRLLGKLGAGADVVSIGEMYRAFRAGITPKRIVFSGVGKTVVELKRGIKNGLLLINIESESELDLVSQVATEAGKVADIAFRINPDVDAKTHAKITTGLKDNKFGIDIKKALALYARAASMPGINATGVAVHIGSQLTDLGPFEEAFRCVADLVKQLRAEGHTITKVDLGGGLGITYRDETPPDLSRYAALVKDIIAPLNAHVVVEPGRSVIGNAGVLLTRIVHEKQGEYKKFLIVDAGMNDLMRPALYDACHKIIPCNEPPADGKKEPVDIVGPVCETTDTFLIDEEMPVAVKTGDVLAILSAGAYGASMSSTYNTRPLAPEALVSDTQFDLIRKIQRMEDIADLDIIPDWLA